MGGPFDGGVQINATPVEGQPGWWSVVYKYYYDTDTVQNTVVMKVKASSEDEAIDKADSIIYDDEDEDSDEDADGDVDGGGGGDGGCFAKGTSIAAERGAVVIEELKLGDKIFSFNFRSNESVLRPIVGVFCGVKREVRVLNAGKRDLLCTPHHRFRATDKWVAARALRVGDLITTRSGKLVRIERNLRKTGNYLVYHVHTGKTRNYHAIHTHDDTGGDGDGGITSIK